jgi:hypothetical protein
MSDQNTLTPQEIDDVTRIMAKCFVKTNNTSDANNIEYIKQLGSFTYIFINQPGMEDKEDEFINEMIQTKTVNPGMSLEDVKSMVVQKLLHSGGKSKRSRRSRRSKKSMKQRRTRRY